MSKRNWVCFDCRSVVRREDNSVSQVLCATCSAPRVNLGYKIAIPRKDRVKQWEALKEEYFTSKRLAGQKRRRDAVGRRHKLEKEIQGLQARPANAERTKVLKSLQKQLRGLSGRADR